MERVEYLNTLFENLNKGIISREDYDTAVMNICCFVEKEKIRKGENYNGKQ